MGHDVFISYSSKDKHTADAVCAVMESEGIRCWIAPRDIRPGADWGESIIDAIHDAKTFVLVFSQHANTSVQIKREVERAVNKGIPVIPFRIEDVVPAKSLEYFLSTPHWLDAFSPPIERHIRYLVDTIKSVLSNSPRPTAPSPSAQSASSFKLQGWQIGVGAVAVAVVAVAGTYFLSPLVSERGSDREEIADVTTKTPPSTTVTADPPPTAVAGPENKTPPSSPGRLAVTPQAPPEQTGRTNGTPGRLAVTPPAPPEQTATTNRTPGRLAVTAPAPPEQNGTANTTTAGKLASTQAPPASEPSWVGKWRAEKIAMNPVPLAQNLGALAFGDMYFAAYTGPDTAAQLEVDQAGQATYAVAAVDHGAVVGSPTGIFSFTSAVNGKSATMQVSLLPPTQVAGSPGARPGDGAMVISMPNRSQVVWFGNVQQGSRLVTWHNADGELDISSSSTYELRVFQRLKGTFKGQAGQWSFTPDGGVASSGTYTFTGNDSVTAVSDAGSITWKRAN